MAANNGFIGNKLSKEEILENFNGNRRLSFTGNVAFHQYLEVWPSCSKGWKSKYIMTK